jgi:hypothetical protein
MKLKISEDFSLPIDAVTQKLAWMGRTGAGSWATHYQLRT